MSPLIQAKVLLFDFYSTLVDIKTDEQCPAVWDGLAGFLHSRGIDAPGMRLRSTYEGYIRDELASSGERYPEVHVEEAVGATLRRLGASGHSGMVREFAQVLRGLSMRRFRLFPGALRTLQLLRARYRLGLVSDAQRVFFDEEMSASGLASMFDVVVVSSDHPFRKPDTRMFQMALNGMGVSAQDAVYIGDSVDRDMAGCSRSGIRGVLVDRFENPPNGHVLREHVTVIGSLQDLRVLFL